MYEAPLPLILWGRSTDLLHQRQCLPSLQGAFLWGMSSYVGE